MGVYLKACAFTKHKASFLAFAGLRVKGLNFKYITNHGECTNVLYQIIRLVIVTTIKSCNSHVYKAFRSIKVSTAVA